MDLKAHYKALFQSAYQKIKTNTYDLDTQIESPDDTRRGLTLLTRPSEEIKKSIQIFLEKLKQIEPQQYYYPSTDLHITVLSLISCYPDFRLNQIQIPEYVEIIQKSLSNISSFEIYFKGITLSPAGILIKGFPVDQTLQKLRDQIRDNFKKTALQQSLDKRYLLHTAHTTAMRFAKPLQQKKEFLDFVQAYQTTEFGTIRVNHLELVYNDWYQRKDRVKLLHQFHLAVDLL